MATTLVMGQNKSSDLVLTSRVRARFCELLGPMLKHGKSDLFLMGMLSLMDAILEVPIGMLIDELALRRRPQGATALREKRRQDSALPALRSDGRVRDGQLGNL